MTILHLLILLILHQIHDQFSRICFAARREGYIWVVGVKVKSVKTDLNVFCVRVMSVRTNPPMVCVLQLMMFQMMEWVTSFQQD